MPISWHFLLAFPFEDDGHHYGIPARSCEWEQREAVVAVATLHLWCFFSPTYILGSGNVTIIFHISIKADFVSKNNIIRLSSFTATPASINTS